LASYAFLSYQTADKHIAGRLKEVLAEVGIKSFLAHEDIDVSEEWRLKILEEIAKVDIFICLLSQNYAKSAWCVQESGIAAFRYGLPVVPLSLDGSIPRGFISHIQSVKVDPDEISLDTLMPAFLRHDFPVAIGILIEQLGKSGNFRTAETRFEKILPHIPNMTDDQVKALLERAAGNDQVHHASLCARTYIPELLKSHGRFLKRETRTVLKEICARYA
jgi:hypothetical protein